MRNTILLFFLLSSLMSDYQRGGEAPVDLKSKTEIIDAVGVKLDVDVFAPSSMIVSDNALIMPVRNMSMAFHVVPLPLTEKTFLAGTIGRGPMDFMEVDFTGIKALDQGFVVADAYGIKKCHLDGQRIVVDERDSTPGAGHNGTSVLDRGYIDMNVSPSHADYEFTMYTKSGKVDKYISKMPTFARPPKGLSPVFLYMKKWRVKPDQKYIAVFYCHFDRMKIINMSGKVVKEVLTDWGYTNMADDDMSRKCYTEMSSVTDEYIPVLHQNANSAEIQIWDWRGNLVRRLLIPGGATHFTIDWNNNKLYYFNNKEENTVFVADIKI